MNNIVATIKVASTAKYLVWGVEVLRFCPCLLKGLRDLGVFLITTILGRVQVWFKLLISCQWMLQFSESGAKVLDVAGR